LLGGVAIETGSTNLSRVTVPQDQISIYEPAVTQKG